MRKTKYLKKYNNIILCLIIILGFVFSSISISYSKPAYPRFVEIDLDGYIVDEILNRNFFTPETLRSLSKITETIYKIADDKDITGILLIIDEPAIGVAKIQELQGALEYAKKNGKKIVCFAESLSGFKYYLATVADEIILAPSGGIEILGISLETSFLKDTFDLIGVKANFIHIGEYKSAPETYTRNNPSEYLTEEMNMLADGVYNNFIKYIADNRKLSTDKVKELIDEGFYTSKNAKESKLIDKVLYYDEIITDLNKEYDDEIDLMKNYNSVNYNKVEDKQIDNLLSLFKYKTNDVDEKSDRIALIYLQGTITSGENNRDYWSGSDSTGSKTICEALKKAREEALVKAVVIRVDSPGGSALASDIIWREINITKKVKPVYISMSDMAASGGYYVSCGSDYIMAEPLTITGSIGVFSGKFNIKGLYDKIGVNKMIFSRGKNANIYSDYSDFSESEKKVLLKSIENTYADFLSRVSEGRNIELDKVKDIARGKVYFGSDALKIGLVDGIGGLNETIKLAATKVSLADDKYKIWILPESKSILELLKEGLTGNASMSYSKEQVIMNKLTPYLYTILNITKTENQLCILPYNIEIK